MATNFPTSVDNFTNPTANDSLNLPSHSTQHANANDAIEAIETTLFAGGINYVGAVHINTTTVTSAASLTVSNVFTSTYDNYILRWAGTGSHTSATTMLFNVSASGSAAPANWARMYNITSDSAGPTRTYAGSQSSAAIGVGGDVLTIFEATIYRPALPVQTGITFLGNARSGVSADTAQGGANHTSAVAYDGIILSASSGNITGTLRVYGMRNA
jgi:hypothetical protein